MSTRSILLFFLRGGVLLSGSAVLSKILGIWRDRLFIEIFGQGEALDAIITAFRIPDFFFFLLISGTLSTILIPRMKNDKESFHLLSSFLWRIMVGFGAICILGIFFAPQFAGIIGKGLSPETQSLVAYLSRFIFGSVFLLSIASNLSTYLQKREQFIALALSPLLYTLTICLGIFYWGETLQFKALGLSVLTGAAVYLFIIILGFLQQKGRLVYRWTPPKKSWKHIGRDFFLRVGNNSAFQINQTIDIFIAGFIAVGAVGAFNHGTNLGNILLSIIGLPIANSVFPKIVKTKNKKDQKKLTYKALSIIWIFTIPTAIIGSLYAPQLITLVYGLTNTTAVMASTVFFWTILSLPATCSIPTLSRYFLANEDTKTPLTITVIALAIATIVATVLVFYVLPSGSKIIGLGIGNFIASTLSFILFIIALKRSKP